MANDSATGRLSMTDDGTAQRRPWLSHRVLKRAGWLLAAAAVAVVAWGFVSRPVPVKTARPERGELVVEVFGTGTLESKVVVGVSSKIIGKVVAVLVDQGDRVTAGQTLALLEDKDFTDAVRVAAAQRDQAASTLAKAKLDFARQRALIAQHLVAQADFDSAETTYRVAESQLVAAGEALGFARAKLADTRIVSPDAALVVTRNLEVHSTVVPGAPIFRIAPSAPWLAAWVDERVIGDLHPGQPARVTFATNSKLVKPGRVARVCTEVDRVTEECEVDIALDRSPDTGFIGGRADVYIETARKSDVLRIPLAALVAKADGAGVFVVSHDRARWRPVQLGLRGRELVEVIGGVTEREVVVLNPLAGKAPISDGTRVTLNTGEEHR